MLTTLSNFHPPPQKIAVARGLRIALLYLLHFSLLHRALLPSHEPWSQESVPHPKDVTFPIAEIVFYEHVRRRQNSLPSCPRHWPAVQSPCHLHRKADCLFRPFAFRRQHRYSVILQDCTFSLTAHGRRSPISYHMHPAGVTAFPAFDALSIDFICFFYCF